MEMNAWGAPRMMVVSDRAFGNCLTREETSELHKTYRHMQFKQFHYSNAATCVNDYFTYFYSYYTRICRIYNQLRYDGRLIVRLYPFIFDADNYINSPTTNKQVNKFFKEFINADVSVFEIRRLYKSLSDGTPTPTICTYDGKVIHFEFSEYEYYISDCSIKKRISDSVHCIDCKIDNGLYIPAKRG
jgi:hypothetical protein